MALRALAQDGWAPRVEYLTPALLPRRFSDGEIVWRFWPVSFRWRESATRFRSQWSLLGLGSVSASPAVVTVINMSALGSRFMQSLGSACRRRGKPYVALLGGQQIGTDARQLRFLTDAAVVVTHTHAQRERLTTLLGNTRCRLAVLPLGVDLHAFAPARENSEAAAARLLFVGRLVREKGCHLALAALAALKPSQPTARLDIVGPESDPHYAAELRAFIHTKGLSDSVHFQGSVPHAALSRIYNSAAVLLLPSESESYGMVVSESMACGTPVIALRDSGGPDELIRHDQDGLLVTREEFAPAVAALLDDRTRLARMKRAATRSATERFDIALTVRRFREIVQLACESR